MFSFWNEKKFVNSYSESSWKTCREFDKSVSFAVYKVNADTMQFDIEHKSVLLGNLSGRVRFEFDFWGLDKEKKDL